MRGKNIRVSDESYKKLRTIAEKTRRTISGTIAHLLDTSGLFVEKKSPTK